MLQGLLNQKKYLKVKFTFNKKAIQDMSKTLILIDGNNIELSLYHKHKKKVRLNYFRLAEDFKDEKDLEIFFYREGKSISSKLEHLIKKAFNCKVTLVPTGKSYGKFINSPLTKYSILGVLQLSSAIATKFPE